MYLGRSVLYGDLAAPCLPGSCTDTGNKVTEDCFFAGRFSAAPMSTSAVVFYRDCFLELYSWDYSKIPFNLGGRINLLYCFFWGFAAIIWMKGIYPFLSRWIEKIPVRIGKPLCMIMVFFMSVNIALSGLALDRYSKRHDAFRQKCCGRA